MALRRVTLVVDLPEDEVIIGVMAAPPGGGAPTPYYFVSNDRITTSPIKPKDQAPRKRGRRPEILKHIGKLQHADIASQLFPTKKKVAEAVASVLPFGSNDSPHERASAISKIRNRTDVKNYLRENGTMQMVFIPKGKKLENSAAILLGSAVTHLDQEILQIDGVGQGIQWGQAQPSPVQVAIEVNSSPQLHTLFENRKP